MATREERKSLNKGWLTKLLRGEPHFIIGGREDPYLLRWFLIPRNRFINVYLHKFVRSDDDRALHDHPWWFLSLILKGGYWEHRENRPISTKSWRTAGSLALRRANALHRVELEGETKWTGSDWWGLATRVEKPCWSIVITGPKIRNWGFACPKGWVSWQDFTEGGDGSVPTKGCGEFA